MDRLSDLHQAKTGNMRRATERMHPQDPAPWIQRKPLVESAIALIPSIAHVIIQGIKANTTHRDWSLSLQPEPSLRS
jgi:hypothetical protein